ncbi:MAG: GIY-YIG nuclease family protein [Anaerolineae bacterium]|nr:GIY-YIG nuclease family protein [Anaerolineae bacterium]
MLAIKEPGTYILVINLPEPATINVGRLGALIFDRGHYLYVGSALGGLDGRLRRHLALVKRLHWHIDYLLSPGRIVEIWYALGPARLECVWAEVLRRWPRVAPFGAPLGASDCACFTHLFYSVRRPSFDDLKKQLETTSPLQRWQAEEAKRPGLG